MGVLVLKVVFLTKKLLAWNFLNLKLSVVQQVKVFPGDSLEIHALQVSRSSDWSWCGIYTCIRECSSALYVGSTEAIRVFKQCTGVAKKN